MFASKLKLSVSLLLLSAISFCQERQHVVVHFDFNQSVLTPAAKAILDQQFNARTDSGNFSRIDITGFCDNTGTDLYNVRLSEKRAAAVKAYLLTKGLPVNTVNISGEGEKMALNQNLDESERAVNRRAELLWFKQPKAVTVTPAAVAPPTAKQDSFNGDLTRQLTSDSLKEGSKLVLENMNFHGGTHVLLPASYPVLKELVAVLKAYPQIRIEIQGHVCCTTLPDGLDNDLGTYDLSVQRAKIIYQYLLTNGIDTARLSYKGFGSSKRLYPDELNEKEQALNRRVEIRIISK